MVTLTRLNVTLYIHCLTCLFPDLIRNCIIAYYTLLFIIIIIIIIEILHNVS
jgi:hypothetical protein